VTAAAVTRPPRELKKQLPLWYRALLPLARPIVGDIAAVTLFRAR
jgi:hypothetical protein